MERYNLKSSIEFGYLLKDKTDYEYRQLRDSYDSFLKQPLTLGMFIPCDENGNALQTYDPRYLQAKERVLFDGFYLEYNAVKSPQGGYLDVGNLKQKTIETIVGANLTLTKSALKQIGI